MSKQKRYALSMCTRLKNFQSVTKQASMYDVLGFHLLSSLSRLLLCGLDE
jgi:hypothetical protein